MVNVITVFLSVLFLCLSSAAPPNFVVFFADDLGFGDLGCYGHPSSVTPNLDKLAKGGLRFSDFYVTVGGCSPSRAALLTGRYETRSGIYPGVLYPGSIGGLPLNETTIAAMLKPLGYATAAIGKWHLGLGTNGTYLPTNHGFDHFLGIPYSHDQGPCANLTCFPPDVKCFGQCDTGVVTVPLMKNDKIIQQPANFLELEKAYSNFATNFILTSAQKQQPFFLYYPSHHTHYPQYAGMRAAGRTSRGPFGDALLEFDDTIGDIMATLDKTGVLNNTLVLFSADNGPELLRRSRGGTAGLLKCGKATTYEGGVREPAIAYWLGRIQPGVTHELASTLDILPTMAKLSGATLPPVVLDGVDMTDILLRHGKSKREVMMFWSLNPSKKRGLFALRLRKYKAYFYTQGSVKSSTVPDPDCVAPLQFHDPPLLIDLESDPSEHYPLSLKERPDLQQVLDEIMKVKASLEASMEFGESQIGKGLNPSLEPCCNPECSPKPSCCQCL
ncbi:arylsulfatase A-like [Boleophthalmus pectinirostris]|uniref:arylsulfatase A-like n=1 Tax=Boleophthalmus pectinirostris TaxID=150288 RepID=UPI00242E788F|nr:arylsulfatase A-like [Boleophthalmus pectinirostris]